MPLYFQIQRTQVKVHLIQKALPSPPERLDLLPTPSVRCSAAWSLGCAEEQRKHPHRHCPGASGTCRSTCAPHRFARASHEPSSSGTGKCSGGSHPQGEGGRTERWRPAGGSGLRDPGTSFRGAGDAAAALPAQAAGPEPPPAAARHGGGCSPRAAARG